MSRQSSQPPDKKVKRALSVDSSSASQKGSKSLGPSRSQSSIRGSDTKNIVELSDVYKAEKFRASIFRGVYFRAIKFNNSQNFS